MGIKKIRVSNFKSFNDLEIELDKLNVLIGANASGKSNFLQIFRFLNDIANHGLKDAISLQGGVEYFRNMMIGSSRNFSLELVYGSEAKTKEFQIPLKANQKKLERSVARHFYESSYKFELEFTNKEGGFKVVEDKLTRKLVFCEPEKLQNTITEGELASGVMVFSNVEGNLDYAFTPDVRLAEDDDIVSSLSDVSALLSVTEKMSLQTLFMETPLFDIIDPFEQLLHNIPIYDFDPRLAKKAIPLAGTTELEEDAGNLVIVLKNILEDKEQRRKFLNLTNFLLPFIEDLGIEAFAGNSLIFTLKEMYVDNAYLPASFISDGTIHLLALVTALYFGDKSLIVIEEPEISIHPFLISRVVHMFEDASANRQIIVTTHNPEIVRHTNLDDIFLISRNKEGFSTISKPGQKETVKTFLENEVGIEKLYVQDLLGV